MLTSEARVPTASGNRYLTQLCKHWGHKFDVALEPRRARISFGPDRVCRLEADAEGLSVTLQAADADALAKLETVVINHLKRFAFRENLDPIRWTRTGWRGRGRAPSSSMPGPDKSPMERHLGSWPPWGSQHRTWCTAATAHARLGKS